MKADIGWCNNKPRKAKECKSLEVRAETWSKTLPQKKSTLPTLWSLTLITLLNCEKMHFCCLSLPVCGTKLWYIYKLICIYVKENVGGKNKKINEKNLRRYLRNKFSSCPVFLTTVIEETIFSSSYSPASFVID